MFNMQQALDEYQGYHQNKANIITHLIGIPIIVFSLLIFFNWPMVSFPPFFALPLAYWIVLALLIFYGFYSWKMAGIAAVVFIPMLLIATWLVHWHLGKAMLIGLGLFVIGWVLQLIGHVFEKKRPAFSDNIMHLLVGPLFILIEACKLLRIT